MSGSCLCGGVRYRVRREDIGVITTCYYSLCRKSHGAERRLRASVSASGFAWLDGEVLEAGDGLLLLRPQGGFPVRIRVAADTIAAAGDRVRASLPHGSDFYRISRSPR